MNKLSFFLLPLIALTTACGEEPAPEPAEVAAPIPEPTESLPPPNQERFAERFAEACPDQQAISNASCRAQGMGSSSFTCEYGLGDDEYLRYEAVLTARDGAYVLADTETVCAQGN